MNELVLSPVSKPKSSTNILPFLLLIFLLKELPQMKKASTIIVNTFIDKKKHTNFNLSDIKLTDIEKGISISKKIGPYLPESSISILNTTIPIVETVASVVNLVNLVSLNKSYTPISSISNVNTTAKISNIISLVKDDLPQDIVKKISPIIDIATNFDKYKPLLDIISNMSNSEDKPNDNQFDMITDMILPFLDALPDDNKKTINDEKNK